MDLEQLRLQFTTRQNELSALLARSELNATDLARAETLTSECESMLGQIEEAGKAVAAQQAIRARAANLGQWATAPVGIAAVPEVQATQAVTPASSIAPQGFTLPATATRVRVQNFRKTDYCSRSPQEQAYRFGQFIMASCLGNQRSRQFCSQQGIPLMAMQGDAIIQLAHNETVNTTGGFLVPPEFEMSLIDLREQFGVARTIFRNYGMGSDTRSIPRRSGGLTAYVVSDNDAITESTKSWNQVNLVAKKIGVLAKYSSELNEDAIIDIGNDLAGEISYAFAAFEDDCAFNGDGTPTYAGIVGVRSAFTNLSGTIANIAGLIVGSGNLYSELTLADFNSVKGKLPQYADTPNTRWVVHKAFWGSVMEKLALAAGGVTEAMIVAGISGQRFLGYPVTISQKMPSVEGNSQVCALLGDFTLGAAFGDRRTTTIAMSEHAGFANDQMQIRGTERFDINVHDVGNQSATAASRVPGPIVGLITAAS